MTTIRVLPLLMIALLGSPEGLDYSGRSTVEAQSEPQPAAEPPAGVDIARAREVLSGVLARKEFQRHVADSALARLQRRVAEWIADQWERLGVRRLAGESATKVFAWVVSFAALAGLVAWLFRSLTRSRHDPRFALTAPPTRRKSARAWAAAAARATDPREVVRLAYNATVTRLAEEGAWKPDAARTPREHLRMLAADHRRRPVVADVTRRFEDVWFAARTPTDDDRQAMLVRLRELGCLP